MRARLVPSRRLALLVVGALGAVLSLTLASESARVPLRTPLVPRAARGEPLAIPLDGRDSRHGSRVYRLTLALNDAAALRSHDELWLFLSSPTLRRRLVAAEVRVRGSACAFTAAGGTDVAEDGPTLLVRSAGCARLEPRAPGSPLDLSAEVKGEGGLSLLGFVPQPGAEPGKIQAPAANNRAAALDVRGHFVWYPLTLPRLVLLNQMWRLPPQSGRFLGLVCAGVALALAGCLVFPTLPLSAGAAPSRASILGAGAGGALLAGSLALLHASIAPPLSAPDEPYHLLGFAELTGDPALARDTVSWMGETHLWRIRQQPAERFRTIDLARPYVVEDPGLRATEVDMRSAVLARLWRTLGPRLGHRAAPAVLQSLRLVNVLIFALAVGGATAFAVAAVSEPFAQWLTVPFLFVPSLPYFAMHVSETAVLCSIYVVLAVSIAALFLDGPRAGWAGLPLGVGTGLMLAAGRSPWPLVGLVGVTLVARVLLGPRDTARARSSAAVFWGGLVVGLLLFFALQDAAYQAMTATWASHFATFIPSWLRVSGDWLRERPLAVAALVASGAGLELALVQPRAWAARRWSARGSALLWPAAYAVVAWVVVSLAGSLALTYPVLPLSPLRPLSVVERVMTVLASMSTALRLAQPDFLLTSSFWVGFGWLDTMPGPAFQALLALLVAFALGALVLGIARRQELRRFLWLLAVASGATAALVLYTLATQVTPIALGGRYLIGWYLPILAVIGSVLSFDSRLPAAGAHPGAGRAALLLVLVGGVHAYCLCFILRRYF